MCPLREIEHNRIGYSENDTSKGQGGDLPVRPRLLQDGSGFNVYSIGLIIESNRNRTVRKTDHHGRIVVTPGQEVELGWGPNVKGVVNSNANATGRLRAGKRVQNNSRIGNRRRGTHFSLGADIEGYEVADKDTGNVLKEFGGSTCESVNGDGLSFYECSCCLQCTLNRHGILCLFESCFVRWGDAQSKTDNVGLFWCVEYGVPNVEHIDADVNSHSNMEEDKEKEGDLPTLLYQAYPSPKLTCWLSS